MKLILTVVSPHSTTIVETDESMVDLLGMAGALKMLKNRAFSQMPSVQRANCSTSHVYIEAGIL